MVQEIPSQCFDRSWRRNQEKLHFCDCETNEVPTGKFVEIEGVRTEIVRPPKALPRAYYLINPDTPPSEDNFIYVPAKCLGHGFSFHNILLLTINRVPVKEIAFALDAPIEWVQKRIERIRLAFRENDLGFLNGTCRLVTLNQEQTEIARQIYLGEIDDE